MATPANASNLRISGLTAGGTVANLSRVAMTFSATDSTQLVIRPSATGALALGAIDATATVSASDTRFDISAANVRVDQSLTAQRLDLRSDASGSLALTSSVVAPQSVTITLEDEIDASRGDMFVHPNNLPRVDRTFEAMVVWLNDQPLTPEKQYLIKHATKLTTGTCSTLRYRVDVNTLHRQDAAELKMNEVGRCKVTLTTPIAFDPYRKNRNTGAFVFIVSTNSCRMRAMRSRISATSPSHCCFRAASPSTVATTAAPWQGGFE